VNEVFLHQVLKSYLANKRQGTHQTKTRNTVSGGNKKPFRQKGTGRARQGTTRAPHHRGGATQFGPQPRSYRQDIPKKMKQEAFRQTLSMKASKGKFVLLSDLSFEDIKTKQANELVTRFEIDGRCLVIDVEPPKNTLLSFRNLANAKLVTVNDCSPLDIFESEHVVLSKAAAQLYNERYAK
jgi:large subunit ribosomal protein L4